MITPCYTFSYKVTCLNGNQPTHKHHKANLSVCHYAGAKKFTPLPHILCLLKVYSKQLLLSYFLRIERTVLQGSDLNASRKAWLT